MDTTVVEQVAPVQVPGATSGNSIERKIILAGSMIIAIAVVMVAIQVIEYLRDPYPNSALILWFEIAGVAGLMAITRWGVAIALSEMSERRRTAANALDARTQVEALFMMTEMLQSALVYTDANAVVRSTATKLLGGFGGALYVFNNSGDQLELSTHWNWPEGCVPPQTIAPSQCWALKRGKPHLNECGAGALHCEHMIRTSSFWKFR